MANGFQIDQQEVGYSAGHKMWRFDFSVRIGSTSFSIPIFVEMSVTEEDRHEKARELFRNLVAGFAEDVESF